MAKPLLEGLDAARRLLLFVWERDLRLLVRPGGGRARSSNYGNSLRIISCAHAVAPRAPPSVLSCGHTPWWIPLSP